ncbi:major capsid protein [Bacteroides thetaiotaomicron]|uniref:major capsid protein n=1 Tax=Bacteroides thetaiotaomicron TaxID=818 RepID=UPI004062AC6B
MANIMSLKSLRNKTSRNGFDLSSKRNFTAKAGELLPVKTWEVLPGDTFRIDLKAFARTQPLNTAAFARMREYYDFYFVPYDLLWNKANTALTQMYDNPQHAISFDPTVNFILSGDMPYLTCHQIADYLNGVASDLTDNSVKNYFGYNRGLLSAKLLEYLGYGNFYSYAETSGYNWVNNPLKNNLQLNLFGLLAYQKIYADFHRDSQWEKISPSTFNVDYMDGQDMNLDISGSVRFSENYNMFDLRYCNWQKDLFHGVVPRSQYGDVASISLDSNVLIHGQPVITATNILSSGQSSEIKIKGGTATAGSNLTTAGSFSILALRQAEFLQKWKEITQSGNKDYKEQIEKHWNVSPGDGFSEMCTYLGGISSSMDINEVVNNNITGDYAADIAGKGTGISNGVINFNSQGRYGLVMCIYHCLPLIDYTTDLVSPIFTKVNATDYAIPEFDRVGMQQVPLALFSNPSLSDFGTLIIDHIGYAPRYIDYKTDVDSSVGAFKTTLNSWVISYDNGSLIKQLGSVDSNNQPSPSAAPLNYTMFKVNPDSLNPIFAVNADSTVDTDQFLCSSFFDVKVVRNLDTDGLPY